MSGNNGDVEALGYEQAISELERIVTELERGDIPLETTIQRFERGVALARRCEDHLQAAEARVTLLMAEGGRVVRIDQQTGEALDEDDDGELP